MYRLRLFSEIAYRARTAVGDWWFDARLAVRRRWYMPNKGPWIAALVVGLVVALFAFVMHTVYAERTDRQSLTCLALNVYFEARGESQAGQFAVAEVTMNRVLSGRYPDTVCGVVYQKRWDPLRRRYVGAFSWTELDRRPTPQGPGWERAWEVAEAVYYRRHTPELDGAMLYHSIYIRPSWARGAKPVARIGRHVFYK